MYYTYILYSPTTDRFYIGATQDVTERLQRHNRGAEKATQPGCPWTVLWHTEKSSRGEAYQLERKLKNLSRPRLITFMIKYSSDLLVEPDFLHEIISK